MRATCPTPPRACQGARPRAAARTHRPPGAGRLRGARAHVRLVHVRPGLDQHPQRTVVAFLACDERRRPAVRLRPSPSSSPPPTPTPPNRPHSPPACGPPTAPTAPPMRSRRSLDPRPCRLSLTDRCFHPDRGSLTRENDATPDTPARARVTRVAAAPKDEHVAARTRGSGSLAPPTALSPPPPLYAIHASRPMRAHVSHPRVQQVPRLVLIRCGKDSQPRF